MIISASTQQFENKWNPHSRLIEKSLAKTPDGTIAYIHLQLSRVEIGDRYRKCERIGDKKEKAFRMVLNQMYSENELYCFDRHIKAEDCVYPTSDFSVSRCSVSLSSS